MQHAPFLTVDTLREVLNEWFANSQCRLASAMPELAVQLFHATAHLGTAREPLFVDFVASCKQSEGEGDFYSYPALETTLKSASFAQVAQPLGPV